MRRMGDWGYIPAISLFTVSLHAYCDTFSELFTDLTPCEIRGSFWSHFHRHRLCHEVFAEFSNLSPSSSYFLPFRNSDALSPSPSHKAPIHIWHFKAQLSAGWLIPSLSAPPGLRLGRLQSKTLSLFLSCSREILRIRLTFQISVL